MRSPALFEVSMILKVDKNDSAKCCSIVKLQPPMYFAAGVVECLWRTRVGIMPIMTSGDDGGHGPESLHYQGLAFDVRTGDIVVSQARKLVKHLQNLLDMHGFDIIDEIETKAHIHIEFQPKNSNEKIFHLESTS